VSSNTRVLILGGGFGCRYPVLEFEKDNDPDFEVTLVRHDNFLLFTPMLHQIAATDLDLTNIVNPIRKMLSLGGCVRPAASNSENNNETESTHNCRGAAPYPRHGSREELETLGALSLGTAMGNSARGLFGLGKLLGLLPPRSCA
jgi:hypothetical protein